MTDAPLFQIDAELRSAARIFDVVTLPDGREVHLDNARLAEFELPWEEDIEPIALDDTATIDRLLAEWNDAQARAATTGDGDLAVCGCRQGQPPALLAHLTLPRRRART